MKNIGLYWFVTGGWLNIVVAVFYMIMVEILVLGTLFCILNYCIVLSPDSRHPRTATYGYHSKVTVER